MKGPAPGPAAASKSASRLCHQSPREIQISMTRIFALTLLLILIWSSAPAQNNPPRVFLLDAHKLAANKQRIHDGDKTFAAARAKLDSDARKALSQEATSVVTKSIAPPSGDKHDYMSQAPYFWPDPAKPNGLPYIRRDGERNPEINKITDHEQMNQLNSAVWTLGLAYYFTREESYAQSAVSLVRTWFLDPATRMNPNLKYAQFIPAVNPGRAIALIETR